ncbi:olfactory receptor 2AT4-like [Poecilia formosa]|uniref:olfactory receptor 2AT4-like n=1 Tax=Poecilia formosa TaxID=48698 RepID=UPI0007BABF0F|nr:PREDICTED: olfactory receptor 2AT4-like [Poecilia formosa]
MSEGNQSRVTEFILTGFPGLHPQYYGLASAVLFLVYVVTVKANAAVFFLFATNKSLHKPVYYIILNVSACDLLFSTTTLPKIISRYWFQSGRISFTAGFVQMYLVHYLGSVNSFIFALMAFDRMITLLGPLAFILFSYSSIFIEISKVTNLGNCGKSLSTCSTQLIIISLYYVPRCFVYFASQVGIKFSADLRIVIIMLYSLVPPMINPLIYCLRAKDIRECLMKQFYKEKSRFHQFTMNRPAH